MSDLRTAAQQALEALEEATNYTGCEAWSPSMTDECLAVAVALRAALEQPEQEPVAWMCSDENLANKGYSRFSKDKYGAWNIPVFTHPPRREWRGLSKDESLKMWGMRSDGPSNLEIIGFARAIEATLKERNHE
jgi:hypothetical protein